MGSGPVAPGGEEVDLGDLSFLLDGADIRYLRWRGTEVLRRVYVTVRDEDWDTPELELDRVLLGDRTGNDLMATVRGAHRSAAIDVEWDATMEVRGAGSVAYEARFLPGRSFAYSRMGLCVLFPPSALIGQRYEAWGADGVRTEGTFEESIAPQLIQGNEIHPLFPAFKRLRVEVPGVGEIELSIAGDLLEMEDQRNWADGSFKAYCTPLSVPRPQQAVCERPIVQRVEVEIRPEVGSGLKPRLRSSAEIEIEIGGATGTAVPPLGTVISDEQLDQRALPLLRRLRLEHVRVDLRRRDRRGEQLRAAAVEAERVETTLAPAFFLGSSDEEAIEAADLLAALARPPARAYVFPDGEPSERGRLCRRVRSALGERLPGLALIGGTDAWFVDVNRERPEQGAMDGMAWSVTPEVHGYDSLTVVEGIEALADQVHTARRFAPDLQLAAGPVTLRPRYNPNARDARQQALDPPPASIDPRQASPFAAAWTVAALSALAQAGVDAVTCFEATGPRGIVAADGSATYPIHQVLSVACSWVGRPVFATAVGRPLSVAALAVGELGEPRPSELLVANMSETPVRLSLGGGNGRSARQLSLDAHTVVVERLE